jgi:hypothetical protein
MDMVTVMDMDMATDTVMDMAVVMVIMDILIHRQIKVNEY